MLSEAVSLKYLAITWFFLNELTTSVKAIILLHDGENELVKYYYSSCKWYYCQYYASNYVQIVMIILPVQGGCS